MNLGQRLKEARQSAGLKQEELAKQLGVSRQTISSWENDRSAPDIGSMVKLGKLYNMSLDSLLSGEEVIRHFEDLAAKRRNFCQAAIEVGIITQLTGNLLTFLKLEFLGNAVFVVGLILTYLAVFQHLRVFDHDRGQIIRGYLGLAMHIGLNLLTTLQLWQVATTEQALLHSTLVLAALILILSANVWRIYWKSPRLWLIVFLYILNPVLVIGTTLDSAGLTVSNTPFPGEYRVAQVLYPEGEEAPKCLIDLNSSIGYIEETGESYDDYDKMTDFVFIAPAEHDPAEGIWRSVPEEAPHTRYELVLGKDDSLTLSYSENDVLQWRWLLKENTYHASVNIDTFGHFSTRPLSWDSHPLPSPREEELTIFRHTPDVVGEADMTITCGNFPETLTLIEEYYHGGKMEQTTYTLTADPEKPYRFQMELRTRYDGKREWAYYRIPCDGGEYTFTLCFG